MLKYDAVVDNQSVDNIVRPQASPADTRLKFPSTGGPESELRR